MSNVLITGGSRGIGAECVRAFCAKGDKVVFTYKSSKKEAERISADTGASALYCDLESEESIDRCISQVRAFFGKDGTDVLINNAAISDIRLFNDITRSEWKKMMDVNLNAPFMFTQGVLPDMIHKKSGRIINVSSMWGVVGASCEVHYSTAKAGIIGMTKALAKELGPSRITVNAVAPGVIDTDMNSHLSDEEMRDIIDEIPLMRIGTPCEIARLILFLSSEDASYITGQVIGSNGGLVV